MRCIIAVPILALLLPLPASSQRSDGLPASVTAGRIESLAVAALPARGRITIDGRLDEAAWGEAAVATGFVQQVPRPGEPASERTEARVLIGDDAVYVGVRLYDAAADSIVAQLARRDAAVYSDWVHVAFDTHHDRRTAFQFGVNAAGVKRDVRITDDVRQDASWDAIWDVAVAHDASGWTAEFRIPLSQLRFAAGTEARTWGFNVQRVIARRGETSSWAPVLSNTGSYVSVFGTLTEVRIPRTPRHLEVAPYMSARMHRAPGDAADPYYRANDLAGGAGVDLRLGVAPWLTLRGTINPDFGQVEADPSVVNLSAFEVWVPERRPFFVEGSEFFRTSMHNLFYSRRIGRSPQGTLPGDVAYADVPDQATIIGAANLTGRTAGGWSIGMLSAVTARESAAFTTGAGVTGSAVVEPTTSYAVARVGRDFRQGRTALHGLFTATNRLIEDTGLRHLHRAAYAGGLDARHRFGRDRWELAGTLYGSHVGGDTLAIRRTQRVAGRYFQRPDAEHLQYRPDLTSLTGTSASINLRKVAGGNWRGGVGAGTTSPGFDINDLGFQYARDLVEQSVWTGYVQTAANRLFRSWSVQLSQYSEWTTGRERIDVNGMLDLDFEMHNHWRLNLWGMRHSGGVDPDALRGGPALHQPGNWMWSIRANTDRRRPVSADAYVFHTRLDGGEGDNVNVSTGVTVRPSARADLRLGPSLSRRTSLRQYITRHGDSADPVYVLGHIDQRTAALELRLNYTFSPPLSLQLHTRPYLNAGTYRGFHSVTDPRGADAGTRFRSYGAGELSRVQDEHGRGFIEIDHSGDGVADIRFRDPDYSFGQVRSNAVVRWEFRPGSTLFLVWSQERTLHDAHGSYDIMRDGRNLLGAPASNTFAIKVSYWFGL